MNKYKRREGYILDTILRQETEALNETYRGHLAEDFPEKLKVHRDKLEEELAEIIVALRNPRESGINTEKMMVRCVQLCRELKVEVPSNIL